MLLTHFIWQMVLKPLSGTNAKNGAITPSLTPTMQARCYNAGKWVRATWRGITNLSKHVGALLVLYLGILWMALLVLVLVLGILWMSQRNHPLGRCRETMDSQGSDVGSGLGWDVFDACRGYVVYLSLVTGRGIW